MDARQKLADWRGLIAETDPVVMVINQTAPLGRLYQPQWLWTKLFCVKIF